MRLLIDCKVNKMLIDVLIEVIINVFDEMNKVNLI